MRPPAPGDGAGGRRSPERAMSRAVAEMKEGHSRARVLFIDNSGWYEPHRVMEASR